MSQADIIGTLTKTIVKIYEHFKVENILKGSLNLIPSPLPSVTKKFVDIPQQCFALLPQVNFEFHYR